MKPSKNILFAVLMLVGFPLLAQTHTWTLQECLDHALSHNLQLKQLSLATSSSQESLLQSKSALLPSVGFSTNQNLNYRPFSPQTTILEGGNLSTSSDALSHNGSYGINANWTLWNGGRNLIAIKQSELKEQQSQLAEQTEANSIQEQIAQLYVQILYAKEAIQINKEILASSTQQVARATEMVELGHLAVVDKLQLEAQQAQDQLSLVKSENVLQSYLLQLKQLLELPATDDFMVAIPNDSPVIDSLSVPSQATIYSSAIENRPEIRSKKLNIENSQLAIQSMQRAYLPSVSLNAGIGTNHINSQTLSVSQQLHNNIYNSLGLSVSIPIFDNQLIRSNIRKAQNDKESAQLELQIAEKQLYSTIEKYYLEWSASQQQYQYALKNVESMKACYSLVNEQFNLGLKNIVELTTGKNNLLQAQQQLLEAKYTALYNQSMLRFYNGENIK